MKQLNLFVLFLCLTTFSMAQTYVELGTQDLIRGDENRQFLPTTFAGPTKIQIFYTNADLLQYGLGPGDEIIGLEWYVDVDNTPVASVFDLYMNDDYTGTTLPSGENFADVPMTLVGSNLVDDFQGTGWHSVSLDNPFVWDGTDNFIIQNCKTSGDGQGVSDQLGVMYSPALHMQSGYFDVGCSSTVSTIPSYSMIPHIRLLVNVYEPVCDTPTNIVHKLEAPARCSIWWDPVEGANWYDVHYRIQGTTEWTRLPNNVPSRIIRNLQANTWYEYFVRSSCDGTWDFSLKSPLRRFNTANIPATRLNGGTDMETGITAVSPNPARDVLNVDYQMESKADVSFYITDISGKRVYENEIRSVEGAQRQSIDISTLDEGYYMIILQTEGKRTIEKFVVAK